MILSPVFSSVTSDIISKETDAVVTPGLKVTSLSVGVPSVSMSS